VVVALDLSPNRLPARSLRRGPQTSPLPWEGKALPGTGRSRVDGQTLLARPEFHHLEAGLDLHRGARPGPGHPVDATLPMHEPVTSHLPGFPQKGDEAFPTGERVQDGAFLREPVLWPFLRRPMHPHVRDLVAPAHPAPGEVVQVREP